LGDAALGEGGEDLAEDVVDVGGVEETVGKGGGDFGAKSRGFQELLLFAGVKEAEGGVIFVTEHAALASVGEGELTGIKSDGFGAFGFHGYLTEKRGVAPQSSRSTLRGRGSELRTAALRTEVSWTLVGGNANFMAHGSTLFTVCQMIF